jgi:outer membrane protein assembly factor BamB
MSADFLVVGALDGTLCALDAQDGATRWTRACGHPFGGPVLVRVGDYVVAAALDGYVCALALEDGTLRWEMTIPDVVPSMEPNSRRRVVTNGEVVVVEHGKRYTGHDPSDGRIVWVAGASSEARGWWLLGVGAEHVYLLEVQHLASPTQPPTPPPPTYRPRRFLTTAISTWDGSLQWFLNDEQSPVEPAWDGASSLVEADGVVYSYGQALYAFEAIIGHPPLRWTWEYLPARPAPGMLVVGHEAVVVVGGSYLGAFRRDTGTPLWATKGARREDGYHHDFTGLLALGEAVYAGGLIDNEPLGGYQIEARSEATGAVRWTWTYDPTLLRPDDAWHFRGAGDTLYVPSRNHLWGLRATDGKELWHREFPDAFYAFLALATSDDVH